MSTYQREGGNTKSGDTLKEESPEHEKLLFKCRMAENSERFDDMVKFIKEACEKSAAEASANEGGVAPLGSNERNFLSVAYKNSVGSRRNALRCLQAMRAKYESRNGTENVRIIDEYYKGVHEEMERICHEILDLIEKTILREDIVSKLKDDTSTREFKVFFHKMYADYYRYLAEFTEPSSAQKKIAIDKASDNYKKAYQAATEGDAHVVLAPSHPIRLGLCLNYSVFLYEIMEMPKEAQDMAKQAFDDALDNLDNTGELEYKDSTLILQLLRDNTTLWKSQDNEQQQNAASGNPAAAATAAAPAQQSSAANPSTTNNASPQPQDPTS